MTLKRQGKCLNFSFTKGPAREIAFPFRPSRPAPTQFTVDKVGHLSFSDPYPPTAPPPPLRSALSLHSEFIFPHMPLRDFLSYFSVNSNSRKNSPYYLGTTQSWEKEDCPFLAGKVGEALWQEVADS